MGNLISGPLASRKFKPSDLPGLLWELPFDEQSGSGSLNRVYNATGYPLANLLNLPENNFNTSPWGGPGTASADTDPLGGSTGWRLNAAGASTISQSVPLPSGTYTLSVYARNFSGTAQTLQLRYTRSGGNAVQGVTTTTNWTRFSFTFTSVTSLIDVRILTTGAGDFSLWGAQLDAGSLTPYQPNGYDVRGSLPPAQPSPGLGGSTFDGVNNQATITGPPLSNASGSIYFVCRHTGAFTTDATLFADTGGLRDFSFRAANGFLFSQPTARWWATYNSFGCREGNLRDTDHVVCLVRDAAATLTYMYIDGCMVVRTNDLTATATATARWLVGYGGAGGQFFPGLIGGIYQYAQPHTHEQVLSMTRHLQSRQASAGRAINPATHMILMDGDSLSNSVGSTSGKGWMKVVMESLSSSGHPGIQGRSWGANGHTVTTVSNAGRLAQLAQLVAPPGCRKVVTVWFGANDLRSQASATAFLSNLKSYGAALVGAGYRVVVATVIPEVNMDNTVRATANAEIANSANVGVCWHAVADLAADANIGANGQETNLTYFNGDQIHLTDAGYAIAAGIFLTAILTQM